MMLENMNAGESKTLNIGGFDHVKTVRIGGGYPVVIQTMWKDRLSFDDIRGDAGKALFRRIETLEALGCGILRFAVPSPEDAEVLGELASGISLPVCADIHFDYKIALRCLDFPVAKLRINPGNIGTRSRVEAVVSKAAARNVPIRIGVNAGSLPAALRAEAKRGIDTAELLVKAAFDEIKIFEEAGYNNIAVSMKASGIADTIKANRLFRQRSDVPLHIGVTEAGPLAAGIARNTAALLPLLADGIGDTIRVSLSDTMENEIIAGREILNAARDIAGSAAGGVVIVSCPCCGRNGFDTIAFVERWKTRFYSIKRNCTIAVMGCAVNGPEEAKHADLGITGAGHSIIIFQKGKILKTLEAKNDTELDSAFEDALSKLFE